MIVHDLHEESEFDPSKHIEKILGTLEGGDYTVACWEPGQVSPYHCHPEATEIYFCFEGGGIMRTLDGEVPVTPGAFIVHPPAELHEYENGSERTLLFRVRYGGEKYSRATQRRGYPDWKQSPEEVEYFKSVAAAE